MATNNRKAGGAWKETRHDKFWHLAKEQGYRSRAAFKLIQLNKKYDFLSNCKSIVDLGAAPGGWLQVAQKYMPVSSLIVGVDLLPIRPIRGVTCIQQDITTEQCKKAIKQELQTWDVDVVLHDGAPNVAGGGSWTKDAYLQNELVIHSLRLATTVLRPGGWFITKIFRSQDYNSLLWALQQFFKKVEVTKPAASRGASAEIFCVCQGYLAPKKIDAKLLDPNVIFQAFDDEAKDKAPDVFSAKQAKRNRTGYADVDNMTQTKTLDILRFVDEQTDQTQAIRMLGDYNSFVFEKAALKGHDSLSKDKVVVGVSPAEKERHDSLLEVIMNHAATTDEVRELCKDLKVLGKGDFKSLLKYRRSIQAYLAQLEVEAKKADGRWEAEEKERLAAEAEKALTEAEAPQLTEEEKFALEIKEYRAKKASDLRKDRKKSREIKAKQTKKNLVNLHNLKEQSELIGAESHGTSIGASSTLGAEEGLFTLKSIKSKEALDYVAETEGRGKVRATKKNLAAAAAGEVTVEDGAEDDSMGEESDDDEDDGADDDEDEDDDPELYARLFEQQNREFEESAGRKKGIGRSGMPLGAIEGAPRNQHEDDEQLLMAKIRARDAKKTKSFSHVSTIGLANVRGAEDDVEYAERMEKDLDFMYETYKERREIQSKKRTGGSELDMGEEMAGKELLGQAHKEEKARNKAAAASRKRKRDAGDSDTDDEDDMDRFNSDESDTSEDEAGEDEADETLPSAAARGAANASDSEDEGDSNPLLRRLTKESKPSTNQRMARWFQKGLLGETEEKKPEAEDDEEEEQAPTTKRNGKASAAAAKGKGKKARSLIHIDAGADSSSSDDESRGSLGDAEADESDAEDEGQASAFFTGSTGARVKTKSGLKPNTVRGLEGLRTATKTVQADVVMADDSAAAAAAAAKGKGKKKGKDTRRPAAPSVDEDGDAVDSLKDAENAARARLKKTTKNYKAQEKARSTAETEKNEAFEEVAVQEDEEMAHFSSDDDAIAERLALGKHMLAKKSRNALINDSYNRYSLDVEELAGLPEWFVRDEGQHHTPILPVTKQEVDTYKEQLKAINTRPIKKIAEAKARKQVKTQKRWEKIKAQAEVIANAEGGNNGDKLRQIEKLFHQKSLKKEKKERVYVVTQKNGKTVMPKSSSGRKGRTVKVDTRMKKDKRGEKKAAQRNKKKTSNANKKRRQV